MKARQLAEILLTRPDMDVCIGHEEIVELSEVTTSSEDVIDEAEGVFVVEGRIIIATGCYLVGKRLWPILEEAS